MKRRRVIASDFDIEIRGNSFILKYHGKKIEEKNISMWGLVSSNMDALEDESAYAEVETAFKNVQLNEQEVQDFVNLYGQLIYKYTRVTKTYKRHGKYWKHFEKATAQCKQMELAPITYLNALISGYGDMNKDSTISLPWPSQLQGEAAEQIIIRYLGSRGTVAVEGMEGRKSASINRSVPIDKDERYNKIKRIIENNGKYTFDDLEYAGTRQVQAYGRRAKWVEKYAERLRRDGKETE